MKREYQLRLWTGLVITAYVVSHLVNHALGIVSVDAMEAMRHVMAAIWRNPVGSLALYGALLIHFALALWSLYQRSTLYMPRWEAAQLLLGMLVPPLLIGHVIGTHGAALLLERKLSYPYVVNVLWHFDDSFGIPLAFKQAALVLIVWLHLAIGLHFWLRLKRGYLRLLPLLYALAVLVPALSLAGFVRAGLTMAAVAERMGGPEALMAEGSAPAPEKLARFEMLETTALWCILAALAFTLAARALRNAWQRRHGVRIHHSSGRVLVAPHGQTLLEAIRAAGLPHASVCGGRARCTTCRVRIGRGVDALPLPGAIEAEALKRIAAAPNVRLACQTRPRHDVWVTPLLPPDATSPESTTAGGVHGQELPVAVMFVDLRGSTALGEAKLPYDVVFILNQFFSEMSAALKATDGHYAQFNGDGLMALYGLQVDLETGCRDAFRGAAEMQTRLEALNRHLAGELPAPLRVGIGLHAGDAIVGTMGPPDAPIYSAIGDSVNIASRLEALSKRYACTLVVSAETARLAGVEPSGHATDRVTVRGRGEPIEILAVRDPREIELPEAQLHTVQAQQGSHL